MSWQRPLRISRMVACSRCLRQARAKQSPMLSSRSPRISAEVDGEEPSDLLAEEPERAVPENVQEPDEQDLLRAFWEEQLVAIAKAAEQAPAASSSSGTAAQPTDKKRATYRRLAAAGLLRKPPAKDLPCGASKKQHTRRAQQRAPQAHTHSSSSRSSSSSNETRPICSRRELIKYPPKRMSGFLEEIN